MHMYLDCIPCFVQQTISTVKLVTDDAAVRERVMREVLAAVSRMDLRKSPPEMSALIYAIIRRQSGEDDPYRKIRQESNEFARRLYPELKKRIEESPRPFETAVRLAIAGNIIDFGIAGHGGAGQIHESIRDALDAELDAKAMAALGEDIQDARRILYIADNAGEIVFDRLLIEQMPLEKITLAVKGRPIINDATMDDAKAAGLVGLVKVIDNGSDAPGTVLETCSDEFREAFEESDLVISKGQGNYETLSETSKDIVFLLRAKCPVVARHLGVEVGSMLIRRGSPASREDGVEGGSV